MNVVTTDAFAHKAEREPNVHLVLPCEGAQYALQYLFDFCRQIIQKGGTDCLYCKKQLLCVEGIQFYVVTLALNFLCLQFS